MAYSLSSFIKHIDREALRFHLSCTGIEWPASFDWKAKVRAYEQAFKAQLGALAPGIRCELEKQFELVEQLADEVGRTNLRSVCMSDAAILREFDSWPDDQSRGLAILRDYPDRFQKALCRTGAERLFHKTRYWSGFAIGTTSQVEITDEIVEQFRQRVREIYAKKDGIARSFEIQHERRTDEGDGRASSDQFTLYREGDPNTVLEFDTANEVKATAFRPVAIGSICLDQEKGTIEIAAELGSTIRRDLCQALVESAYSEPLALQRLTRLNCSLQRLKKPVALVQETADGIAEVKLVRLELKSTCREKAHTTLDLPDKAGNPHTLHEIARRQYGAANPLDDPTMRVSVANIRVTFEPSVWAGGKRTINIRLSEPNGCNLREHLDQERLLMEKYLEKWQLRGDPSGFAYAAE